MKTTKSKIRCGGMSAIVVLSLGLMVSFTQVGQAAPMGTAWTYQGRLIDANGPADGPYDLQFALFTDPNLSGSQIGPTVEVNDIDIIDGYFTVELDFGSKVFNGDARWLQIGVRPGGSESAFNILSPRQEVTPTPYAIYAENAGTDSDWMVSGNNMYTIPSGNVGIGTTTPTHKLEVKAPTNQALSLSTESTNSHVDIQGTPTGSGSMRFNVFGGANAITFNVNSNEKVRMNSNGDVGIGTASPGARLEVNGQVKITGGSPGADKVLTSDAGGLATWQILSVGSVPWTNLTGVPADFADNIDNVGLTAESDPTVLASVKDGVSWGEVSGIPAGFADGVDDVANSMPWTNLTGIPADFADNIDNVGLTVESDPTVAASVKDGVSWGEVSGIPAGFADGVDDGGDSDWQVSGSDMYSIPSGKVGIGTTTPRGKLDVKGEGSNIYLDTGTAQIYIGDKSGFGDDTLFTVDDDYGKFTFENGDVGIGTTTPTTKLDVTGSINTTASYEIGGQNGLSVSGTDSLSIGPGAGANNTGSHNTFSGYSAGYFNTTGYANTFSGLKAGYSNTTGNYNTFLGNWAGYSNTEGGANTFTGYLAGYNNTTGCCNTFSGLKAGYSNTEGTGNTFSGHQAGLSNTEGTGNTFSGASAGYYNTIGTGNVFIGNNAGYYETGSDKLYIDNSGTFNPLIYGDFASDLVEINGTLDVKGPIWQRGGVLHADYVFRPDYELESIDKHSEFMWQNKHLPAIPKAMTDEKGREIVEVGAHRRGIVEELEKAHIYIDQLHKQNKLLEARLVKLEAMITNNPLK
ncbi:MAG: hypothetical protein WBC22_09425 [Sedimentisphaerales bacterium]